MEILSEKERIKVTRAFGNPITIIIGKPKKHMEMEMKPIKWRKKRKGI